MEAQSEHVTRCVHILARSAPTCHAQSAFSNKISASELRRKFTKSALLVGYVGLHRPKTTASSNVSIWETLLPKMANF